MALLGPEQKEEELNKAAAAAHLSAASAAAAAAAALASAPPPTAAATGADGTPGLSGSAAAAAAAAASLAGSTNRVLKEVCGKLVRLLYDQGKLGSMMRWIAAARRLRLHLSGLSRRVLDTFIVEFPWWAGGGGVGGGQVGGRGGEGRGRPGFVYADEIDPLVTAVYKRYL